MSTSKVPRGLARRSVCAGAALAGAFGAWQHRWLCDDAFISFRYAENLIAGHGLVFNVGERVEGMTNLVWTLWIALGVAVGASPELWSIGWSIAAFAGACGGLAWMAVRDAPDDAPMPVPWAGLGLALHPEALVFATSGLETAALCCALVFVLVLVTGSPKGRMPLPRRAAIAGVLTAVASGLRPDAILLAPLVATVPLVGRALAVRRGDDVAGGWDLGCSIAYGLGVLALWLPLNGARIAYYGDFFPNTYYAKSADIAWWSQGLVYLRTFYARYGVQLLALPLAAATLIGGDPRRRWSDIMIGIGFVAIYTLYVVRVGGGFMYARLLIPTVPLLLVVFEAGLEPRPAWLRSILGVVVLGVPWLVEPPLWGTMIVDERGFYTKPEHASAWDRRSRIMRHYLRDTDVRVAFLGTWARAMRDTQIDPAIEAATGLTDATIAHQPLARRGQPGHEKAADPFYLADERRVHLVTGLESYDELGLERVVPRIELSLPDPMVGSEEEVVLFVVRWDPTLMSKLEARGAVMPDLPAIIEDLGRAVPRMRPEQCRLVHTQLRRLYFDQAPAPALAAPFEAACPLPAADPTSAHRSVP